jgi:hypothetical protein
MTLKVLKGLQITVGVCVVGIVVSFAMSIVVAVQRHHAEVSVNPSTIPTPAAALSR